MIKALETAEKATKLFKLFEWLIKIISSTPSISKFPPGSKQLRDFICYNQGKYTEFNFMTSRHHRDLKDEMRDTRDPTKIAKHYNRLTKYVNQEIGNACVANFNHLKEFYKDRKGHAVRICIKGQTEDGFIRDLTRDRCTYKGIPYLYENNTGFYEVFTSGKTYLCNNIPEQARRGYYKNPRLNQARVMNYNLSRREKRKINRKFEDDYKWNDCWDPPTYEKVSEQKPVNADSAYKSTLIVPMTLIGNSMCVEFTDCYNISRELDRRGIWGYLCFDNHSQDFFHKDIDNDYGYIAADILSLYFITRLTYTVYSKTYKDAEAIVVNHKGGV